MKGLQKNEVSLVPFDENWGCEFASAKDELIDILGDNVLEICHVGSTAIKGIFAKPIIDIHVVVKENKMLNVEGMQSAGYIFDGECDLFGHMFHRKTSDGFVTHHVKCYLKEHGNHNNVLLFCKYLNENPDYAKQYNDLKCELALKYPCSREEYTNAKADFIENILELARTKA
ncbi:MAG: GrpB family protein [Defluviitaleaceae bacterium]|nr:GrpB family protein [Defluviitaleaceae bacterium]